MIVAIGAVLLSLDLSLGWTVGTKNIAGVIVNLVSSLFSGASAVILRNICITTEKPPFQMSIIEVFIKNYIHLLKITMFKMLIGSVFMTVPALILDTITKSPTIWEALFSNWEMNWVLIGGVIITLMYQSAVVAVTSQQPAITVGVLHQLLV